MYFRINAYQHLSQGDIDKARQKKVTESRYLVPEVNHPIFSGRDNKCFLNRSHLFKSALFALPTRHALSTVSSS